MQGKHVILLSLVHTKNNNYKDNDNIHTSRQYCLFIISARSSDALNPQAHDSRIDSDWMSMFLQKIILKMIPTILFIFAFIVIVLGVNRPYRSHITINRITSFITNNVTILLILNVHIITY